MIYICSGMNALYSYTQVVSETDITYGTFTDTQDGQTYKTIQIGNQVWMAENLKATRLNDGTAIQLVTGNSAWSNRASPGYCWYNNDEVTKKDSYGALYNWYAVNIGKLCPTGWHVPKDNEWATLTTYIGGEDVSGGKLKETGTTFWNSPNNGATNETGFTARPGGQRNINGTFNNIGVNGYWWSNTEYSSPPYAWSRLMQYNSGSVYSSGSEIELGFSVRCVKD